MKVVADIDRLFIYSCRQCNNQSDMQILSKKKKKNRIRYANLIESSVKGFYLLHHSNENAVARIFKKDKFSTEDKI